MSSPQIVEYSRRSVNYTPFATCWVPRRPQLVVLGETPRATGTCVTYRLNKTQLEEVQQISLPHPAKCATFAASLHEDQHLAFGDYSGELQIWDLEYKEAVYTAKAHDQIINCIDGCGGMNIGYGSPEIVTGSRDGSVRVFDPRQLDPVTSLEPAKGQNPRDCWAVCFGNSYNDNERSLCAGYDNGDVKLLDLRTNKIRWQTNVANGVVSLQFDRKDIEMNKLIVTTLESKFRVYDVRTQHSEQGFAHLSQAAHKSTIWLGRHLPQNRDIFATLGGNGEMQLWKYCYPMKRFLKDEAGLKMGVMGSLDKLAKHTFSDQPIVSFEWNPEKIGLCAFAALDQSVKVALVTKLKNF